MCIADCEGQTSDRGAGVSIWMRNNRRLIKMTGILLMCSLIFSSYFNMADAFAMLRALIRGRDPPIGPQDKELIRFWMNAGRADGYETSERCSVDYIKQLQHKIETDMQDTQLSNVFELYYFAELDLLSSCGDRVAYLAEEATLSSEESRRLLMIAAEFNKWFFHEPDEVEWVGLQGVAECMIRVLGVNKCLNSTSFMRA